MQHKITAKLFLILIVIDIFTLKLSIACDINLHSISDININFDHAYNMMSSTGLTQSEQIKIHSDGKPCDFFVTFDAINGEPKHLLGGNGSALPYELYNSLQHNAPLTNLANTNSSNIFYGIIKNNQKVFYKRFYIYIPYNQNTPSGNYQGRVMLKLYEGNKLSYILRDTEELNINVLVQPRVDITIHATRGSEHNAILDFGTIRIGDTRSFIIDVEKNIPYDISLNSENSGYLVHQSKKNTTSIPYNLELNGEIINLESNAFLIFDNQPHNQDIDTHIFNVIIDDFNFVVRGKYKDSLIFTVTAR